jgi:alkanesulfonate monooxygenase SsuD/methylene tetrahydromethanopterin reductase-like flavin-dependent oxidoreductase (luciferase family)
LAGEKSAETVDLAFKAGICAAWRAVTVRPRRRGTLSILLGFRGSAGPTECALAAFGESRDFRRTLLAADPDNDGLRCDVATSQARVAAALAAYRDARDDVLTLCDRKPDPTEGRSDLAVLDERIAALARCSCLAGSVTPGGSRSC